MEKKKKKIAVLSYYILLGEYRIKLKRRKYKLKMERITSMQ